MTNPVLGFTSIMNAALRDALLANSTLTALLDTYVNVPAVFARDRAAADIPVELMPAKFVVVSPTTGNIDRSGVNTDRPVIMRQITAFGNQPDDTPTVDYAADLIREMFNRKKFALTVQGFRVMNITATHPIASPVSDVSKVGRLVGLMISLEKSTPGF